MGLETGNYVADLVETNPSGSEDKKYHGDDHLRLIKGVLKNTFPGFAGRISRVQSKGVDYTVIAADNHTMLECSAGLTLSYTSASSLGNGHLTYVYARGGAVVIDPSGTELVNGSSTLTVPQGAVAVVFCDGVGFHAAIAPKALTSFAVSLLDDASAAEARTTLGAMSAADIQNQTGVWCGTAGGTANALTLTPSPAITAYAAGQVFVFKSSSSGNTGATTVAISGLSAVAVQVNGAACNGGEILPNRLYRIVFDTSSTCQLESIHADITSAVTLSSSYTVVPADNHTLFECTATLTLSYSPAATLGPGHVTYISTSTGVAVFVLPTSGDFANGSTSVTVQQNTIATVFCDGDNLHVAIAPKTLTGLAVSILGQTSGAGVRSLIDAAAKADVQNQTGVWCGTAGGTANALTLTPSPAITAYAQGQSFVFASGTSGNTGATTVAISGLSPIAVQVNHAACGGGEILPSRLYRITLNTTSTCQLESISRDIIDVVPPPGGRLTLSSTTPVTFADITGATTVYYLPYVHNTVCLYNGSTWIAHNLTGALSQSTTDATKSPAAVAADSVYDVFVWNDGGTLRATRGPAWVSLTSRGTGAGTSALERFQGRLVNAYDITNGPAARRGLYVGTIASDSSAQIVDSLAKRFVWNNYNRVMRPMRVYEHADSWTYTTAAWRQANGNSANQIAFVRGIIEDSVSALVCASGSNNTAGTGFLVGIGLDSTTSVAAGCLTPDEVASSGSHRHHLTAHYVAHIDVGRHFLAWLEYSEAVGTTTWYGDRGMPGTITTGIQGEMLA